MILDRILPPLCASTSLHASFFLNAVNLSRVFRWDRAPLHCPDPGRLTWCDACTIALMAPSPIGHGGSRGTRWTSVDSRYWFAPNHSHGQNSLRGSRLCPAPQQRPQAILRKSRVESQGIGARQGGAPQEMIPANNIMPSETGETAKMQIRCVQELDY
jgi:hypothetical protein